MLLVIRREFKLRELKDVTTATDVSKTTTLHVHRAFWYISLLSLHDYDEN